MSCAPPIINDPAFAFSSIFHVKIPFSNFESPLGPIFQDKIVRILIDGIKLGYLYWILRGRKFSPGAQAFVMGLYYYFFKN